MEHQTAAGEAAGWNCQGTDDACFYPDCDCNEEEIAETRRLNREAWRSRARQHEGKLRGH